MAKLPELDLSEFGGAPTGKLPELDLSEFETKSAGNWDEVKATPEYKAAGSDAREVMRDNFFVSNVMPSTKTEDLQAVRNKFDSDTKPTIAGRAIDAVGNGIKFAKEVYDDAQKREADRIKQEGYARANKVKWATDSGRIGSVDPKEEQRKIDSIEARKKYESSPVEAVSEIVKQGYGGLTIDAPAAVNKAGQAFSPDGSAAEDFFKQGANYWESNKADFIPNTRNKGVITNAFASGARAIPLSGAAMAAAGTSLLTSSVAAPIATAAGIVALFGGSQFTDTYEKGVAAGLPKDQAFKAGLLTGGIEGLGETLGDFAGGKFLSGLGHAFAQKLGTKEALTAATSPRWAAKFGKDFLENMAVQAGTEYGQGFGETAVENRYGISNESPIDQANQGAMTAVAMSFLMGGGAIHGHRQQAEVRKLAGDLLEDPAAPIEQRAKAAEFVRKEMEQHIGAEAAKQWHEGMVATMGFDKVQNPTPENVPQGAMQASDILGTPEQAPDLYPDAKPGSLSSAANIAAKNGITPVQNTGDIAAADFLGTPEVNNAQLQPGTTNEQSNNSAAGTNTNLLLPVNGIGRADAAAGNGNTAVGGGLATEQSNEHSSTTGIDAGLSTAQQANSVGIPGHPSEVVLPDNTTLPAQWQVVDADQVKATLKEGKNQPRDRSRAAANVQVQGIANNPNYTLLRDSPVMDFGSPTISHDGAIVGGNGRFEGISRAYDQGSATDYRAKLMADAASKGIDPDSIAAMKKPVLVRRITQPFDTRALAVASNSGGSLQYSALEQAKIDGDRMQGIGDIEVNDVGDVSLTGDNMANVRRALAGYTAAEMGSLTDKDGQLSQEGVRRIKNALLYKAYGNSSVLSRIVESADPELKNVMGALVRAASTVAGVRADMADGHKPASEDIVADLLSAVEQLVKVKAEGISVEQHQAQMDVFGQDHSEVSASFLRFLNDNIRSQKRMATFIQSYYDSLAREDNHTGSMFDTAPTTKQERVSHAIQEATAGTEAERPHQQAANEVGQQPENASKGPESDGGSTQSPSVDEAAKAKADADIHEALGDLGAIMRDVAGVQRLTPEETQKLLPVLVRLFDAAFRKGYYDVKDAIKFVRGLLAENDATKKFAQFIPKELMESAAASAAKAMPAGFFDNQGMFAQDVPKAESNQVERRNESAQERRTRYNMMSREQLIADLDRAHERERRSHERERTSYLTGLPNRVAFDESAPMAVTASADIDGMKTVNDTLGHAAGDSLIKAKADALRAAVLDNPGVKVYHQSGDEFIAQANTVEEIDRAMKQAQKILFEKGFEYKDKDGNIQTKKGVGFSYGTGSTYAEADSRLEADKKARKAAGLRTGERDTAVRQAEGTGTGKGNAGNDQSPAEAVSNHGTDEAASVAPVLSSYTNAEVLKREAAAKAAEEAANKEELTAKATQGAKDKADLDARKKAYAENPDNFQFGESSKDSVKPMGDLFNQGNSAAPITVEKHADLKQAEKQVNTNPTDGQKEAGNYAKGHIDWNGLDITIENPAGSERSGTDSDGKKWSVTMPATYGYIKRTEGADGDHVDVYIGEDHASDKVYVIDQQDIKAGKFDEHKVMLGFPHLGAAVKAYKAGFSDGKGAQRMGAIASMSLDQFKTWLADGDTTKPAAKYTPPAAEKQGGSLADALEKYEGSGEIATIGNLVNEVQRLIDEDIAPDSLQNAVDTYRDELDYSNSLKGRGDMDSAEEALISAITSAIEAKPAEAAKIPPEPRQTSAIISTADIPKSLKIPNPETGEGQYSAREAMDAADKQVEKLEALKRCIG